MGKRHKKLYGTGLVENFKPSPQGPLRDRHIVPPFSTFDTRDGRWQDRKRRWLALGIQSEQGRDDALTYNIPLLLSDGRTGRKIEAQTSIFDPMLCEVVYEFWARPGYVVLDPFAGGSVRGIVASVCGLKYWGCELRKEQVESNRQQLGPNTRGEFKPVWFCGDSLELVPASAPRADIIFSCPPYGNLEKYSDDPADISNMDYKTFLSFYSQIIYECAARLRDNRYAVWVVANYRDKSTGIMHDLVGDTIRAFKRAGLDYYNDIVLINVPGSGPMRANTSYKRGHRKMVKLHQNVLVFIKGDARKAAAEIAQIDVTELEDGPDE